jgi:hypothetical protein
MKNIIDICKEFGIEIPADKHAEFNKAVSENYKTIAEHEKKVNRLTDDLDAEKKRADTAVETLKGFEGKDFEAITRDRDEWKRKYDENQQKYQQEQEEREYNADLEAAMTAAKCRDIKALTAHLDHDALRKSRNRKADMEAAINAQRTERAYLFDDNGGNPHFTDPKGNGGNGGTTTLKDIMKIKDPVERQKMIGQNLNLFGKD